jgi:hypothetical protein
VHIVVGDQTMTLVGGETRERIIEIAGKISPSANPQPERAFSPILVVISH